MSSMGRAYPSELELTLNGARANGRAVVALIYREASQRFGSGPLSYVWTLVEPSILIGMMLIVRVYLKNYSAAFGDSSVLFLLTGYLTFRMTRGTINSSNRTIVSNQSLFKLGGIKPVDVVVARTVVEFSIWLAILVFFFSAVGRILGHQVIANFQDFILALIYIFYFVLAMSLFNATVGALFPMWRSIWRIMTVPLLFLSGVLYVPASMPPDIIAIISWNPFLHCIEGLRSASYLDYISLYQPVYLNSVSTIVLIFSLGLERLFRKQIIDAKGDDTEDEDF